MALSEIMHDQLILVTLNHQNDYNYQVLLFTLGATTSSHAFCLLCFDSGGMGDMLDVL